MSMLKLDTVSLALFAILCTPAQADILGDLGGSTGASIGGSVSGGTQTSVGAGATATANTGIVDATVCVGVNAPAGCNASGIAAGINLGVSAVSLPTGETPPRFLPNKLTSKAIADVPPAWLVGMTAIGSEGAALGTIQKASRPEPTGLPLITVQLDSTHTVQLRNAVAAIDDQGVWLVVSASKVQQMATKRWTAIAIR